MLLGDYNRLKIIRKVEQGVYLEGDATGDVLLPAKEVPEGVGIGDELNVFLYLDQEERLIATTKRPYAKVGEFAQLEVAWVNKYGAFLKWGLLKDLFCPFSEQRKHMEVGQRHIVHIHLDEESYRIVASAKVERYIEDAPQIYQHNQAVDLLVWQRTDLGYKVIVDNRYQGLVYQNQIFRNIHVGQQLQGFVNQVRADGKMDISLQPTGVRATKDFADVLLEYLESNGGMCELGDKSAPEDIQERFSVSKKVYKKAIGDLYKRRLIRIEEDGIKLNT